MVWELLLKVCPGSAGGSSQLPWLWWNQPGLGSSTKAGWRGAVGSRMALFKELSLGKYFYSPDSNPWSCCCSLTISPAAPPHLQEMG